MRRSCLLVLILAVCFASCLRKNPEHFYFGVYSDAEELYNKGDYAQAIQKYQQYIDENPEGNLAVISYYYIAKSNAALGQVEEARKIYNKIVAGYPELIWANFSKTQLKELESKSDAKPEPSPSPTVESAAPAAAPENKPEPAPEAKPS